MSDKKNQRIDLRISAEEKKLIQEAAKILDMSMAEFVREMALNVASATVLKQDRNEVLSAFSATATEIISRVPENKPISARIDENGTVRLQQD